MVPDTDSKPPCRGATADRKTIFPETVAISTSAGSELARHPIPAAPAFTGMAAAGGELFLTLESGHLLCLAGK